MTILSSINKAGLLLISKDADCLSGGFKSIDRQHEQHEIMNVL